MLPQAKRWVLDEGLKRQVSIFHTILLWAHPPFCHGPAKSERSVPS